MEQHSKLGRRIVPTTDAMAHAVHLVLNGRPVDLLLEPRVSLLDALRERLGLTGTKKGCDPASLEGAYA